MAWFVAMTATTTSSGRATSSSGVRGWADRTAHSRCVLLFGLVGQSAATGARTPSRAKPIAHRAVRATERPRPEPVIV